jgi:hypothetical protein
MLRDALKHDNDNGGIPDTGGEAGGPVVTLVTEIGPIIAAGTVSEVLAILTKDGHLLSDGYWIPFKIIKAILAGMPPAPPKQPTVIHPPVNPLFKP